MAPAYYFKKKCRILTAIFFTCLGLYLRYKKLASRDLWCDELCQLSNTAGFFKPVWQRLTLGELTCFPGEYLLNYSFVRIFGGDKWLINIPHYIITFFGFYFLYLICQKYLKTFLGFVIAFLVFCFNANLIFHSFEFRPYAVLPTLSLASFYFSEMIVSNWQQLSTLKKFLIGIFFISVIIYHAYGIMIVGLCLLYFVILEANKMSYKEVIKEMMPFLLPVGLLGFLLFIWYASGTTVNRKLCQELNIHTFAYYPNPLDDFTHFIRQVSFNLMAHKQYGQKHLALGIWIALLIPHKDRFKQIGFFLLLIILPIQLLLISDLYSGYWFLDRQFIWVMPLYAFFLGWCWDVIFIYVWKGSKLLKWLKRK
ncbi:MAG: glycosyltransferase family 39 protein [Candidatus Omnitrophica bacterium]|nr:glycosyltransferase family 39 protein [Candidatus Omnitrophota bacterium]